MAIWLPVVFLVGALPILLRTRRIRQLAREHGYIFLGTTPRRPFDLSGTTFAMKEYSTRNLLLMAHEGTEIAYCDLRSGQGKGAVRYSIAAFRREGPLEGSAVPRDRIGSYQFQVAEDWLIASLRYLPPADEVDIWSQEARQLAISLLEQAEGKGIPTPRFFTGL